MRTVVNGIGLGYDVRGEGSQSLVLLHAFPLHRRMWAAQAEALAALGGIQVVTLDFRGCGESDGGDGPATMEQLAADTLGVLDALDLGSVVLGGISMGGYVAFACLRQFPERVRGLLLADTRATADTPEGRVAREATARFVEEHGAAALFDRDAEKLFGHVTRREQPDIVARARSIAAENSAAGLAAAARGMALRPDATDLLPHITCPALIIVGEQDAITPVADARALLERIPDAEFEVIADAGHLSNLERPEAFTAPVAHFLRERVPPRD